MTENINDTAAIQRQLRKHKNTLTIIGAGMIALGVWGAVKVLLGLSDYGEMIGDVIAQSDVPPELMTAIFYIVCAILTLIYSSIFWFIGFSARSVGLGRKDHRVYIGVTIIMISVALISTALDVWTLFNTMKNPIVLIVATLIVDITVIATSIELVYSAISVRRLTKLAAEAEKSITTDKDNMNE